MKQFKNYVYAGLPVLGVLFYLLYIRRSAIDMVYSDYIRLINSYLPDVWNPDKFFVPDLLTRIPINYLERAVNVQFFGYSVTFDRVMGILGFGLSAGVLGAYSRRWKVGMGWYVVLMAFLFSLNKWEMLYNGTGWAHFLAFACFYYNYLVLDRVWGRRGKKWDFCLLFVLPAVITIGVAGPYCAIYSMTLILAYVFLQIRDRWVPSTFTGRQTALLLAAVIWPLLLYLWSNSQAVYEYSGAVDAPLLSTFLQEPKFFLTFLLKSFSSMVFGVELIHRHMSGVPDLVWCLLGLAVIASYFLALWMNFYYRISEKTLFPLMLLASGGMNHLMVLVSRWIFIPRDEYGMSSRYALQYQAGILGILLTFALVSKLGWRKNERNAGVSAGTKPRSRRKQPGGALPAVVRGMALFITVGFLAGNLITTAEEFSYGIHRKNYNMTEVKPVLLNFENETEDELKARLEFRKPGTKEALSILKEHGWNIFKGTNEQEVEP